MVAVVRAHPCIYNGRERGRVQGARRARARHRGADEEPAGTGRAALCSSGRGHAWNATRASTRQWSVKSS